MVAITVTSITKRMKAELDILIDSANTYVKHGLLFEFSGSTEDVKITTQEPHRYLVLKKSELAALLTLMNNDRKRAD